MSQERDTGIPFSGDSIDAFFKMVASDHADPVVPIIEATEHIDTPPLTEQQLQFQQKFMEAVLVEAVIVNGQSHPETEAEKLWKNFPKIIEVNTGRFLRMGQPDQAEAIEKLTLGDFANFADRTAEEWGRKVGSSLGSPDHAGNVEKADLWARYNMVVQAAYRMEQQGRPRPQ